MEITINREIGKLGLPRHLVLGMDPGIASCGFALIDTANHEILDLGVRLFDSPTHPKTGKVLRLFAGASALPVETLTVPRRA